MSTLTCRLPFSPRSCTSKRRSRPNPDRSHRITTHAQSTTERIFKQLELQNASISTAPGGAGAQTSFEALQRMDKAWTDMRTQTSYGLRPQFVRTTKDLLPANPALDVIIAGGTLGIFLAAALQRSGLRVAVVERGILQGRTQEWNVSRKELRDLVSAGAFDSLESAEECISIEFNPVRAAFHGYPDIWTRNVLNLGVSPEKLVRASRKAFEDAGGVVLENFGVDKVWVHPNGVQLRQGDEKAIACKLLVDCMGNQSPIVKQIRHGRKPDGVCLVVGTCARGFDPSKNTTGDVIITTSPSEPPGSKNSSNNKQKLSNLQLFWEAFPSGSDPRDRTTYMFTYLDASPDNRPSLHDMLEHYWTAMPLYQGLSSINDVQILRILFGVFPTYKDSPLPPTFDRILAVGDASGLQSPLSFGGLAAMSRNIDRLRGSIVDAVHADAFNKYDLKYINPYNPSLSSAWMMQRAMSISAEAVMYDRDFINRLLGGNFRAMEKMGDSTLKPFLQDVIQAGPLAKTLVAQVIADPLFVLSIFGRVGIAPLADWLVHFVAMVMYTGTTKLAEKLEIESKIEESSENMSPRLKYLVRRAVQRWRYGSGLDYTNE